MITVDDKHITIHLRAGASFTFFGSITWAADGPDVYFIEYDVISGDRLMFIDPKEIAAITYVGKLAELVPSDLGGVSFGKRESEENP